MDCGSCAAKIENAVRRLDGIEDVAVSVPAGTVTIRHRAGVPRSTLAATVTSLGFGVADPVVDAAQGTGEQPNAPASKGDDPAWWRGPRGRLTLACGGSLAAAYLAGQAYPAMAPYAFLAAMAVGLMPIAWRALVAARLGTPFSIEMLMTIAAVGAVFIGAVEEAASVVFLFLVGELLEGVAASRARASIRGLTDLVPRTALVERDGRVEEVPAETLVVGSTVMVRPGDRIPADGTVSEGTGEVDEAPVTGESVPKRKSEDDPVFAGTINGGSVLRVRVTAAARDNTIARVVRLVEETQDAKAPTERFIDRFSRYYTPAVVAVAVLVATVPPLLLGGPWHEWIYKGLATLLIGCPCALVISTPAAIAAGLSAGARRGLLIKGGAVLETLGTVTMVAFDKTGTLTLGKPRVTDVVPFGRPEREVLSLAAALESGSNHPLARAILAKAAEVAAPIPPAAQAEALAGKGIFAVVGGVEIFLCSAQAAAERIAFTPEQASRVTALTDEGKTVSVLIAGTAVAGLVAMRDEPRPDAVDGIAALRSLGVEVVMLTGDNSRTAGAIAKTLGMTPRAELLPEDKLGIVREMQAGGKVVAKVGDGINDAPALAAADVGIAMGGAADVALETADAAILHGRVADVSRMILLSRRTMANIRANVVVALGLKAVLLCTTVLGITGLWPAILADTGATVLVTANALRLFRTRI
ncbi:cadmium-translocating P-type ATPase [Methylobacterium sp. BTF04]|uniref:heavy metal translocating P-type ATPase n=1 Tax=Methylobacterium sp. BTF04 TaxID=2708300 RepID=UPI0013D24ED7|nr:heavy metal translocating P-type ATPase [Methylobacterium sp. BTF04]NEU14486.1 cadmium-translocating P-type ATPase [Methylobacterium sp. BTF04]